jgi:hypothetical protein
MSFQYSKHATQQIKARGIDEKTISAVIASYDKIVTDSTGLTIYQKLIQEQGKDYLYRVFVNKERNPFLIVTAYKTTKISKYENQV